MLGKEGRGDFSEEAEHDLETPKHDKHLCHVDRSAGRKPGPVCVCVGLCEVTDMRRGNVAVCSGDRGWNYAATSQTMPGVTRGWKQQGRTLF